MRPLAPLAALVLVTSCVTACGDAGGADPVTAVMSPRDPADLFVAPGGTGPCVRDAPCGSIDDAVARADPDDVIELAAGRYPEQVVDSVAQGSVRVRGSEVGAVRIAAIRIEAPDVTIEALSTGSVYVAAGADRSVVDGVRAGSVFVTAADDVVVRGSTITNGDDIDGIQVKGLDGDDPERLLVDGNFVGDFRRTDGDSHVDCIQILGGRDATIRDNVLYDCPGGLMIGSGAGGTVDGVHVEGNAIRECRPRTTTCDGHHAVTVRAEAAHSVRLVDNRLAGSVALSQSGDTTGFAATGNIAESIVCIPGVDANLVEHEPCGTTDRRGEATFVAPDASPPDLTLTADSLQPPGAGS